MLRRSSNVTRTGTGSVPGFALFLVIAMVAVLAVLATVIAVNLTGDNDQKRVARAADILRRFELETVGVIPSFNGQVTQNPGLLSELVTKPLTTDRNSCTTAQPAKTLTSANLWRGPYHLVPIPTTGYNLSPGFFANNLLVRNPSNTANGAGTLAIVMNNVSAADAVGLGLKIDGVGTGAGSTGLAGSHVQFTLSGTNPITVQYLFPVSGC